MEFSNLGKHCSCEDCYLQDFLPFKCNLCQKDFCLEHRTYESHKCKNFKSTILTEEEKIKAEKERKKRIKSHPKCIKCKLRSGTNFKCKTCGKFTCISHRMAQSHNCSKHLEKAKKKNADKLQNRSNKYTNPTLKNKFNKMSKIFGTRPTSCAQEAKKTMHKKKKDHCVVF